MASYGAAEGIDPEAQRFIKKGAEMRRNRLGLIFLSVGALALIGCAAVLPYGQMTELMAFGGIPNPAAQVPYSPATTYNIYAPHVNPAEERERALREEAYLEAIRSAQASQDGMAQVIRHYISAAPTIEGYKNLQAASTAWAARRRALETLDAEIAREQGTLEKMHTAEGILRTRHDSIAAEIQRLEDEATETAQQIEMLKGQYGAQVRDLQIKYQRTEEDLVDEKNDAQRDLDATKKAEEAIHAQLAAAMVKANYYNEQALHAKEDVEGIRTRAKASEQEARDSKKEQRNAESMAVDQEVQAADSVAEQQRARASAKTILDVSRIEQAAAIVIGKKEAKATKVQAEARVQEALGAAAKKAAAAAEIEEEDIEDKVQKMRDSEQEERAKIYEAKGQAADAEVSAVQFVGQMQVARSDYDAIEEQLKLARRKIAQGTRLLETAGAKGALLATQTKIDQLVSTAAQTAAAAKVAAAEQAKADSDAAVGAYTQAATDLEGQSGGVFAETLAARAAALAAQAQANLAQGQAKVQDDTAVQMVKSAEERRQKAEALLASVNELTKLAKEAASMAQAERIKAESEAAAPAPQPAWIGPFAAPPPAAASYGCESPSPPSACFSAAGGAGPAAAGRQSLAVLPPQ